MSSPNGPQMGQPYPNPTPPQQSWDAQQTVPLPVQQPRQPMQQPQNLPMEQTQPLPVQYQHSPQMQIPPATPTGGGFLAAVLAVPRVFGRVLKGQPVQGFQMADRIAGFWPATFAVSSLAIGLALATVLGRTGGAVDNFINALGLSLFGSSYSSGSYFSLSFGEWLLFVLLGAALTAATLALRALTVSWVFGIRGVKGGFTTGARIVSVAYSGHALVLTGMFLVVLLPGAVGPMLGLFVGFLLLSPLSFMAELLIYVGINRAAPFAKSPMVPHVLLTGVWGILLTIASGLIMGLAG